MLAAVEERTGLTPRQRAKTAPQKKNHRGPRLKRARHQPQSTTLRNPRRALVVGAADAACWAMQRRLVHMLVRKGLMTELALGDEVRAILIAQREMLGEEGLLT